MNAQAITDKILQDARAQAAQVLAQAQSKAEELRQQSEEAIEQRRVEMAQQAESQAAQLRDRMLRMAELDQKKALLAVKRQVIDQAFEDARRRMQGMARDQKQAYIRRLVLSSAQGGEELIPSQEDAPLFDQGFVRSLNEELTRAGKAPLTLSRQTRPLEGGFVLKLGGLEINCAFAAVLQQARASLEAEVARLLFD